MFVLVSMVNIYDTINFDTFNKLSVANRRVMDKYIKVTIIQNTIGVVKYISHKDG